MESIWIEEFEQKQSELRDRGELLEKSGVDEHQLYGCEGVVGMFPSRSSTRDLCLFSFAMYLQLTGGR